MISVGIIQLLQGENKLYVHVCGDRGREGGVVRTGAYAKHKVIDTSQLAPFAVSPALKRFNNAVSRKSWLGP